MYIKNLHVDCKPFYELPRSETKFAWTPEHEKLFNDIKNRINEDTILAIPDTKYPFHVHVDASSIGVGSILVQEFPERKRIVSFNSRIYTKEEQKLSTTARELCGVTSALQTYEHYLIGSPHPVYVYTDNKPLMYLWGRRGKLSHRFFQYQLVISQFQNLRIICTEGKNLAFPDILIRNVKIKDLDRYQLKHKKIQKNVSFYDQNGYEEKYFVLRDSEKGPADNFFPILKQSKTGIDKYVFKNDEIIRQHYNPNQNRLSSGQMEEISEDESYSPVDYVKIFLAKTTLLDETGIIKKLPDPSKIKDAKKLIEEFTTFFNEVDLNTEVIWQEQLKDPVLQQIRHMRSENNKNEKNIEFRQSKAIMAYINKFEKLCFVGNLLCIKEHSEDPNIEYLKICVPLSLFFKNFSLAHC